MFDWLGDIIGGIGDAIGSVFSFLGEQISNVIFDTILQWFYTIIYNAVADFFTMMGNMGAEIFDLEWVDATVHWQHLLRAVPVSEAARRCEGKAAGRKICPI